MARVVGADREALETQITALYNWCAEKHPRMYSISNIGADGLRQQKTMSGSTALSQEQKYVAAVGTGSPKLDS